MKPRVIAYLIILIAGLVALAPALKANDCIRCQSIPGPTQGFSDIRLRATATPPAPANDGVGAVRTVCAPSHYLYDDPIIHPNNPGAAHLHLFWGNTSANAHSTPDSLVREGNGTCRGGIINRSAYWMPAILDGTDGTVIQPRRIHVYYKTGYDIGTTRNRRNEAIIPPPIGMMVATIPGKTEYEIRCANGAIRAKTFAACAGQRFVDILIDLPQCWDGTRLSSDDQSHLAYSQRALGGCPVSHPLPIPQITFVVNLIIPDGRDAGNLKLSSDHGQQGGSTMHADWMNGWLDGREVVWTTEIINRGLDGGSHHAGNNQEWF